MFDEIKFDKNKLYKSFTDIKNVANIQFIKCYKDVFKRKNLLKNCGFFIFIGLLFLHLITLILFYGKFYYSLMDIIKKISDAKNKKFKYKKQDNSKSLLTNGNIQKKRNQKY